MRGISWENVVAKKIKFMTNTFKIQSCYKVKVKTTNSSNDTFYVQKDKGAKLDYGINNGDYLKCEEKICYVMTDDAARIYEMFGDSVIISVEKIGVGYTF